MKENACFFLFREPRGGESAERESGPLAPEPGVLRKGEGRPEPLRRPTGGARYSACEGRRKPQAKWYRETAVSSL